MTESIDPWKEDEAKPPALTETETETETEETEPFDPLASPEEQAAKEAWETSEGHPPPARPQQAPLPPSRSSSPFPSLATLARTFSLPNLTRARPVSVDGATNNQADDTAEGEQNTQVQAQFDFQKFLDQMKMRGAEPVSKYLRSFLSNFTKRNFPVSDQVRIIGDFLSFIAVHMRECEVWRDTPEAEFDNALEGMEKLVMNRLYDFTFTPQIARAVPSRPYNPDDLERDRVLDQRISLFGWIEESHLDVPVGEGSPGFIMFAQQELLKINHYKAPRDKLICILNCCKVIFGLIRHLRKEEGADSFVPILIFVVLKSNPPYLMSNVEFINRFRNPTKLQGEAGYYLSSLIGAISFIETMDHTSLSNITREEFESNVEAAIQALPGSNPQSPIISRQVSTGYLDDDASSPHAGEESAQPLALSAPTPAQTIGEDARRLLQKTGDTISKPLNAIGRIFSEALDGAENKLSYLPGPFAPFELGREQGELPHPQTPSSSAAGPPVIQTPYKPRVRKMPPSHSQPPSPHGSPFSPSPGAMAALSLEDTSRRGSPRPLGQYQVPMVYSAPPNAANYPQHIHSPSPRGYPTQQHPEQHIQQPGPPLPPRRASLGHQQQLLGDGGGLDPPPGSAGTGTTASMSPLSYISQSPTPALDLSGMQAEIDAAHANAANAAKETLRQIFPGTDVEVIEWVLEANGGDLGKSIEALLEMSNAE